MMNLLQDWLKGFSNQFVESGLKFSNLKSHAGTSSSVDFESEKFIGKVTYWPEFKFEIYGININDEKDCIIAEEECENLEQISIFIERVLLS